MNLSQEQLDNFIFIFGNVNERSSCKGESQNSNYGLKDDFFHE